VELPVKFGGEVAGITHNDHAPSRIVTPLFPEVKWAKETGLELVTTRGGGRYATSVGGTLAGGGAALIIVDDPLNARDAYSEPARKRVIEWYGGALVSRLNDKETGSIIAVMQRLHQDDLAGHLREDGGWDCLDLPAIALDDQAIPLGYGRRPPPARRRHPPSRARKPCGSRGYQSRNRQRRFFRAVSANADPAGRSDDQTRLGAPQRQEALQIIQSWDTAMKGGPANDWSVCTTWAQTRDGRMYLLDVWRDRVDYPTLRATVRALYAEWKPHVVLIEESGTAIGLIEELEYGFMDLVPVKPDRDKIARTAIAS
jgi:hypothetical protein